MNDHGKGNERLWFPTMTEVIAQRNRDYLHSLWLGTVSAILLLPELFLIQIAFPVLQILGRTLLGITRILMSAVEAVLITVGGPLLRWPRMVTFGVFGYLDTEVEQPIMPLPRVLPSGSIDPGEGATPPDKQDTHKGD